MSSSNPTNQDPFSGEAGSHPVGTGAGAGSGAIAGAAIGALGGPIGAVAGAVLGAIAGGLAGKEIAEGANPTEGGAPSEHLLGTGVGASGGALAGAAIGAAVAGPVGLLAGAAIGVAAGGTAGRGAAEVINPQADDRLDQHSLASGAGAGGGAITGAALGAVGGPVGMVAGAALGALAVSQVSKGLAQVVNPVVEDAYWRDHYGDTSAYVDGTSYEDYAPAFRAGYEAYGRAPETAYEAHEAVLLAEWERLKGSSRLSREQAVLASRAAWNRVAQMPRP